MSKYKQHDGGRAKAGHKGSASDCVVRAIAIATGRRYQTVFNFMKRDMRNWYKSHGVGGSRLTQLSHPGRGVSSGHYGPYLRAAGWYRDRVRPEPDWTVADAANYYKSETVIVTSRRPRQRRGSHMCAIRRGTVLDTWDCRESQVLGVWRKLDEGLISEL